MKCVTVSNFFPAHQGGLEIVVGELMARLAAAGVTIDWFASSPAPMANPSLPGLRHHGVRAWNGIEDRFGLPMPFWHLKGILALARAIRRSDIVFINDCLYFSSFIAWLLARACGKKIVVLQHIDEIPFKSTFLRIVMHAAYGVAGRIVLGGSDRVVFCSHKVSAYFTRRFKWLKNTTIIQNGVDTSLFCPDERTSLAPRPRILFAGRFVERKGLDLLRQLARNFPGCDWIFAGWGVMNPESWQLKNVHVKGRLDRQAMAALYHDCDLLVLPSVGEGFPLVVQEAVSCGLPVLVSPETASGDPGAINFLMVANLTLPAFDQAVRAFLQRRNMELDPVVRRRRHDFAVSRWSWDVCVQKYLSLFSVILPGGVVR